MPLNIEPNLADPDGFYAALLAAHRGLDTAQSRTLDSALVLILGNHVGDSGVLAEALALARETALGTEAASGRSG